MTISTTTLIVFGGVCHFGILTASVLVPRVLNWKETLAPLSQLSRHVIWTHGVYLAGLIFSFGLLSVAAPHLLTDGTPLARIVCGFIAVFWGLRLALQTVVFDAREYLGKWWLRAGYYGLTMVFMYLTLAYGWTAFIGRA